MSSLTTPTKGTSALQKHLGEAGDNADQRYKLAGGLRHQLNKVFPTHWSFLLGEIALYSFIIILLTGVYLTLFFDPSMQEVTYNGSFKNMQGMQMSQAFKTTLDISFDVRGGLFVRQLHHWAALIFVASMMVHMLRVFFTGAFRKPREANWVIGGLLLILGMFEGFFGYSLPDDLLSGTGIRATLSGIVLSVPVIGTWIHWALFGGEFPGDQIIPRLYTLHILLVPGIMLALIGVHVGLVWYQKHTQFPGVRRKETNVVGVRIMPYFALKASAFFILVFGVLALMSGLFQINPVWNFGPYNPSMVSAGSQPDFYMAWADGMLRIWPAWEVYLGNYTIPAVFFPGAVGMPILFALLLGYPFLERKLSKDNVAHNLLQRPRDAPVRTALGMMALGFFMVIELSGFNDIIADQFDISLNATTWAGRIGVLIVPPIAYYVTYRICLGLQRADREVLDHGVETGIIKRLPHGEFIEIHQPLGGTDSHGHAVPLEYQGAPVPKKMNKLGTAGHAVPGTFWSPDPAEETAALDRARGNGNGHKQVEGSESSEVGSGH
ncbi:cytochrome b [Amycolatopsis jejuensis]|uniref:cytochrome bc1 complex cytochrome b subunit n=1 Tax=Amycolatopsis jejuensis TaxID=330084 RepID=UPI0005255120|nr:cytochrome bc complex cytochrome b subunit [Amycolatopsis jejuensis]